MNTLSRALFFLLTAASVTVGAPPTTEEEFISQVRGALSSKDSAALEALTYRDGMSEQDMAMSARGQKMMLENPSEIAEVVLKPLPKDFQAVAIMRGRKVEMTGPPVGVVEVTYKDGSSGAQASSTPYTVINNSYFLVGAKSSDLGWTGPMDKNIGFMVMGQGTDNVKIQVLWNASGVTQTREFFEPSSTFWGQHIDSVTIISDSDGVDVTMTVLEDGQTIHTSEPLKGKGTLQYKREGT